MSSTHTSLSATSPDGALVQHFFSRVLLQPSVVTPVNPHRQQAAVLLAITSTSALILTRRTAHLRHHPGQVAFPGGRLEPTDASPIAAALRESEEETGLAPDRVTVLATLPPVSTSSGFLVTPVLGRVSDGAPLRRNPQEVADILTVPLPFLLRRAHYQTLAVRHQGRLQPIRFCWYGQTMIWGMTAAVLYTLACLADPPG